MVGWTPQRIQRIKKKKRFGKAVWHSQTRSNTWLFPPTLMKVWESVDLTHLAPQVKTFHSPTYACYLPPLGWGWGRGEVVIQMYSSGLRFTLALLRKSPPLIPHPHPVAPVKWDAAGDGSERWHPHSLPDYWLNWQAKLQIYHSATSLSDTLHGGVGTPPPTTHPRTSSLTIRRFFWWLSSFIQEVIERWW